MEEDIGGGGLKVMGRNMIGLERWEIRGSKAMEDKEFMLEDT